MLFRSNGRWRRFRATRGVLACRRWRGGGRPRAAAERRFAGGEREQRGRQGKEKLGLFAISKISRDLNVKQG